MWHKLVLTAGTDSQNVTFREQLSHIPIEQFCEAVEVVTDAPTDVRIGSGGATLNIIRWALESIESIDEKKMLLVHSGGLSQRMPHLSAYGKAFGMLPNGKTLLETKLLIYKEELLNKLPSVGGIMISASDVLENMQNLRKSCDSEESDLLIFAHSSSLEVGTQHGVFVMEEETNELKKVLQKPSIEEMKREEAVREDGTVLTDSCYFMTWKFCKRLLENRILRGPVTEELCCYGDFMRPIRMRSKLDYIESSPPKLAAYRRALADVFKDARVEMSILGKHSFFHFGTYQEFLEHLAPKSEFREYFPLHFKSNVLNSSGFKNIPETSFVEFSSGNYVKVGSRCLVSQIDAGNFEIKIPDNTVVFTMSLKENKFVSMVINIDEDIKRKWDRVKWNKHDTGIQWKTLWEAPIFGVYGTRLESLKATLGEWERGIEEKSTERVSICEAVVGHELGADLDRRRLLTYL